MCDPGAAIKNRSTSLLLGIWVNREKTNSRDEFEKLVLRLKQNIPLQLIINLYDVLSAGFLIRQSFYFNMNE